MNDLTHKERLINTIRDAADWRADKAREASKQKRKYLRERSYLTVASLNEVVRLVRRLPDDDPDVVYSLRKCQHRGDRYDLGEATLQRISRFCWGWSEPHPPTEQQIRRFFRAIENEEVKRRKAADH